MVQGDPKTAWPFYAKTWPKGWGKKFPPQPSSILTSKENGIVFHLLQLK